MCEFFAAEESRNKIVRPELKWGLYLQFRAERSEFLLQLAIQRNSLSRAPLFRLVLDLTRNKNALDTRAVGQERISSMI